jgi:hypothetical protein
LFLFSLANIYNIKMSQFTLPKILQYDEPLYSLPPNTQSFQVVCNPLSGSTFGPNTQIDVDLGSRGYLNPKSLHYRYKMTTTSTPASYMVGCPAYTPFQRLNIVMNSQNVEQMPNFNVVSNLIVNTTKDIAQKVGEQQAYGYADEFITSSPITNEQLDGGLFPAGGGSKSVSAPLICSLSSCEKLIPLHLLNGVRLSFFTDSIANMFSVVSNSGATPVSTANTTTGTITVSNGVNVTNITLPTDFQISNFEVVYDCIDFDENIKSMVSSLDKIRIKSNTWGSSSQTLASGVSGQQNLIYNHKYSSVKALFLNMGGATRTISANGNMDSYNIAGLTGDYQFSLAGINYPQRVLSCANNNGGIFQALRQAIGSIYDKNNAMSINSLEWNKISTNTTQPIVPAKFWVGVSTEKLKVPGSFFTGISTEASPISAIININTATSQPHNVMMIVNADLIFEIDPQTKQVVVIQ